MDWVAVYESHTPYEWIVQTVLNIVDPWGDDRADLRAETNTLATVAQTQEALERLTNYLQIHERNETVGPASMRQLLEG
jgi:hypothetical protein